jgi:alkylation response protein AidB-like acyl-CoA dehydrogenase
MTAGTEETTAGDTPEQATFRREVRRFLEDNAEPKREAKPWDVTFQTDAEAAGRHFEDGRAWQATRYAAGMAGFTYPKEYGGQDGPAWMDRIYDEEARNYGSSSGFVAATIAMLGPTLMAYGTEEQKRELIPRLLSAEEAWCQLFSEPGSGSDLASLGCRAVRDGSEFVVNGQKVWNSAAQWCDHGFLLVRTDPDVPKHQGITMLLVEMGWPGIEVRPLVQATGAAHFNEVFLNDVRVPVANVLGEINGGWAAARTVLSNEAALIGGNTVKTFPLLLRLADAYSQRRDPVLRQQLADFYSREQILEIMGRRIVAAIRQREKPPIDPALLKLYVTDKRIRSSNLSAAISGPAAMAVVDDMTAWVNSEIVGRYGVSIGGGTTEVQKNNLAERALGLPREPSDDRSKPWSRLLRN